MQRTLITGSRGQLGTALRALLPDAVGVGREELDIADAEAVLRFVRDRGVGRIVNCAAYTAVDRAEDEPERAEAVNAAGPGNLARSGAPVIHISTDYVFDGEASVPYAEDAPVNPLSVYGRTKLAGERAVLANAAGVGAPAIVIRTSWLYSPFGKNFLKTMLRLGAERDSVRVVDDQIGAPTSCFDLARAIAAVLPQVRPAAGGVYHFANAGRCSWRGFAAEIMAQAGLRCAVEPITTAEYPARAARPRFSVFDTGKISSVFGVSAPHWKEGLRECLKRFS